MDYRVGYCQFKPLLLQPEANRTRIREMLSEVNADLIVLPELATSGYFFDTLAEVESVAEAAETGPTAVFLRELAQSRNCSIMIGFPEREGRKLYNSAMLVNPDGTQFVYRKTHLFYREKLFFSPGNTGFQIVPAKNGIEVGMMICFDWYFPESARTLALDGAKILIHSANLVLPWCQQAMITRSLENRVFSITCNRVGTETRDGADLTFTGCSQVLGPRGEILSRAEESGEALTVVKIDTDAADDKHITPVNLLWDDRRPEMYHLD
jgi:predicted amidohydrolase